MLSFFFGLLTLYAVFRFYETRSLPFVFMAFLCGLLAYWSKKTVITFLAIAPLTIYFFTSFRLSVRLFKSNNKIVSAILQVFMGMVIAATILTRNMLIFGVVIGLLALGWIAWQILKENKEQKGNLLARFYESGVKYFIIGLGLGCLSYEPNMIGYIGILALLYILYLFSDVKPGVLLAMGLGFIIASYFITDYRLEGMHEVFEGASVTQRQVNYFENPLYYEKDFGTVTATGFTTLLTYFKLMFVPYPLRYYYGYNQVPIANWQNMWAIFSLLLHAALLVYALIRFWRKSVVSYGILFYLAAISIYANVVKPAPGIVGERFANIASLGFCIVIIYTLLRLLNVPFKIPKASIKWTNKFVLLLIGVSLLASVMVIDRNRDWKDDMTLYANDIKHLANSAKANHLYAQQLLNLIHTGKVPDNQRATYSTTAEKHFKQAIAVYPDYTKAWNNLGYLYLVNAKYDQAIPQFAEAIKQNPEYFEATYNIALCYELVKQPGTAIEYYKKAMQLQPTNQLAVDACLRSATIYSERGQSAEALEILSSCLQHNPENLLLYQKKTEVYYQAGNFGEMLKTFEEAHIIAPDNRIILDNLVKGYLEAGDMEKATEYRQKLERL